MLSTDSRAYRNCRGRGDSDTVLRGNIDTLTAASKVDASSGCLASDCSALRAGFGIPKMNYENNNK